MASPPLLRVPTGGVYQEVTHCSPYEPFLLALNCHNFKRHLIFSVVNLKILFMLKQQHCTQTNFKKVKSPSTTPLKHYGRALKWTSWCNPYLKLHSVTQKCKENDTNGETVGVLLSLEYHTLMSQTDSRTRTVVYIYIYIYI